MVWNHKAQGGGGYPGLKNTIWCVSTLTDWFGLSGGGGPRGGTGGISAQGKSYKVSNILWFFVWRFYIWAHNLYATYYLY